MGSGPRRSSYSDSIEKVRQQHENTVKAAQAAVECPRCGTKQVISDVPGMRRCLKCGFEFRKLV